MKNLRRKALAQTKTCNNDLGSRNVSKSQGADGSGITSTERMREPLPCQGRKELISLAQEARQSQNQEAPSVLSPLRKRIVAPPQNVDNTLLYPTPMPLVSAGLSVGSSHLVNRGMSCVLIWTMWFTEQALLKSNLNFRESEIQERRSLCRNQRLPGSRGENLWYIIFQKISLIFIF